MFIVGIPTINQADRLKKAIQYYKGDKEGEGSLQDIPVFICDNGRQGLREYYQDRVDIIVFEQEENLGVSASWNLLCDEIFNCEFNALILNDDLIVDQTKDEIIQLIKTAFAESNHSSDIVISAQPIQEVKDTHHFIMSERLAFGAFIIPESTFSAVGQFDTNFFPAYFEDNDYYRRVELSGRKIYRSLELTATERVNSASITKDPSLNTNFETNKKYYIEKWGGLPHQETYNTPFNK